MEAVERDLGLGQMLAHPGDAGAAHVDAGGGDPGCVTAMRLKVLDKRGHGALVAPFAGKEQTPRPEVVNEGDVLVAPPCRGLVDPDAAVTALKSSSARAARA